MKLREWMFVAEERGGKERRETRKRKRGRTCRKRGRNLFFEVK